MNVQTTAPAPTVDVDAIDRDYRLDSRYEADTSRVFLTGTQALVRLLLEQRRLDRRRGLNTAGFVSGYRGSPLAVFDSALWQAKPFLDGEDITFKPAINEDLAASAVIGTQQVESDPDRSVDGVFGLWYGKGPGVDRSGDALKHGNAFGSSPHGGVLVVAGDDHGCVSSSMSHQSEHAMMSWFMPVVNPASVAEYVEFGLFGFALSRFSGAWVGFKAISETVESGASVRITPPSFTEPDDYTPPEGGLHYRWPDLPGKQFEARFHAKLEAAKAFARANPIDREVLSSAHPRLGIVTTGKAHLDTMEALARLGIDEAAADALGIKLLKIGLSYPLDDRRLVEFARGLDEVVVVEEKRSFVEAQLKDILYNLPEGERPRLVGKRDETGAPMISEYEELQASALAPVLRARILNAVPQAEGRLLDLAPEREAAAPAFEVAKRVPYFCSGCPHNTSTKVPDGSKVFSGIGCHFMATWMDRQTEGLIQMGGEGVNWVGRAPFTGNGHVFQNLGDGTYFHSGALAIRQAIAAGINITFKILYNDAVAMTGGQPVDGTVTAPGIAAQVRAEGVSRIALVSEDPSRHRGALPAGVTVHHRDDLDKVQRELRDTKGVTVLIYDQACATETRRRRKRGQAPDPARRVVINEDVCEGCGDCSTQSNCVSVIPKPTELGVKRQIDQSSCNKDFSCLKGFCPSFVTVEGGELRKGGDSAIGGGGLLASAAALAVPDTRIGDKPHEILIAGVGGTGVVTIGAIVTMAAHLEGKGGSVLDFMGFAQKGGAVVSHVKLSADPDSHPPVRIDHERAGAVLACDTVVATSPEALRAMAPGRAKVVANTNEHATADFVLRGVSDLQAAARFRTLAERAGEGNAFALDANRLAVALFGDSVFSNMLMLGYAWQRGLVPLAFEAIDRAIALNGVAVERNRQAFAAGRLAAADADFAARVLGREAVEAPRALDLDALIERRRQALVAYQGKAYAKRYADFVEQVRAEEARRLGEAGPFTRAVAENLFKLMAYKDEYEVARLYTQGDFMDRLGRQFQGDYGLSFHMAPPLLSRAKDAQGRPKKIKLSGRWLLPTLKTLARLRRLRGTPLDPFGYLGERREERRLIGEYRALIEGLLPDLKPETCDAAVELANAPQQVRGFGPVKEQAIKRYRAFVTEKRNHLTSPDTQRPVA